MIGPLEFRKLPWQRVSQGLHVRQDVGRGDKAKIKMIPVTLQSDVQADPVCDDRHRIGVQQFRPIRIQSRLWAEYVRDRDIDSRWKNVSQVRPTVEQGQHLDSEG